MASKNRIKVIMRSTAEGSSTFYTTHKNKQNKEKLVLSRYDSAIRKHVDFREEKMK